MIYDRWANFPFSGSWTVTVLIIVGVVALIVGFAVSHALRQRTLERIGHLPQLKAMMSSRSTALSVVRPILIVLGVCALGLAWARPQDGGKAKVIKAKGIDLVIVLDFSKSMYARDIPKSRIDRAKQELSELLDKLGGDRVGLVAFAGSVKELPLTTDYAAVKLFLQDQTPNDMPVGGTAIGLALTSAVRLLQRVRNTGERRDQVILLITDGEDHGSDPLKAAKMAHDLDIRVYTLGIGSPVGELIPVILEDGSPAGYLKDREGKFVTTKLDSTMLRKIADKTSGKYIQATAATFGVERFLKLISGLKTGETSRKTEREYHERYHFFLFLAFLLLLIEAALGSRRWRTRGKKAAAPAEDAPGKRRPDAKATG